MAEPTVMDARLRTVTDARLRAVTDARLRAVADSLRQRTIKVLSLDIFDTLLWRRVPEPADVFLMLGAELKAAGRLAPGVGVLAFAEARRAGERAAREKIQAVTGYREVKLTDIYAAVPDQLFITGSDIAARAAAEVACEQRLLTHDHALAALMETARGVGAKVILVSDTYFTAAEIRVLLTAAGMQAPFDRLYVSCEAGKPKYRDLFDVVLKDLGVAPGAMLHIGDSYEADVAPCAARRIGHVHYDKWHFAPRVQAKEFPADLVARDAVLAGEGDFGLTGLRSRLRHHVPAEISTALRPYWQIGAAVLAPPLAAFARWVVGQTKGECVFGIMREGRFLGDIVAATAAALGANVKTQQLWLSRRAVIGAALYPDDLSLLGDFIMLAPGASTAEVLEKIGLSPADAPGIDFAQGGLQKLIQAIADGAALREKVLAVSARHRRNLLAGLGRHIDLSAPRTITLMDLGYAATIQAVLARILAREGAAGKVRGLYFALNDTGIARRGGGLMADAFLGAGGPGLAVARLLSRTPDVLEHACMCPEGSLEAYDDAGAPVLLPNQRSAAQLEQMATLQAGIRAGVAAVNALLGNLKRTPPDSPALAAQAGRMVEAMILHPTAEEAATVGGWLHEANFDLNDCRRLTDLAFDPATLEYRGLPALQDIGRHQAYWPAAALARVNPFLAEAFAAGAIGAYGAAQLTAGPVLGGLTIIPDLGAGFDPKRGGAVALAVNAFGRAEITVPFKAFGAEAYGRVKLSWPAAAAVAALDHVSIIARGEQETRRVEIISQDWSGAADLEPAAHLIAANPPAEVILTLGAPPAFAHALEMTLRLKYLRLDPVFGGRA